MNDVDRLCEIWIAWNKREIDGDKAMYMIHTEELFKYVRQGKWLKDQNSNFFSNMGFFGEKIID